jgi:hypothetical protein
MVEMDADERASGIIIAKEEKMLNLTLNVCRKERKKSVVAHRHCTQCTLNQGNTTTVF